MLVSDIKNHILSSIVGTITAEIATMPIYTLKTYYQNQNNWTIPKTMKHIYNKHGIKGFYASSVPAILSQVSSTTIKYTTYQTLVPYTPNAFAAGALTGVIASMITHPIDVIKIHTQMQTPFIAELKTYGPKLFYRGYSKSFSKSIAGATLVFPLYDISKQHISNITVAAIFSALISTILIQPLDYMKTRHVYGQSFSHGFHPTKYYKGLSVNLLRIIPHFIITMNVIEYIKANPC
jgi:hypothetical protein